MSGVHWVGAVVIVGLVGLGIFGKRGDEGVQEAKLDAVTMCQRAVRDAAINRQAATVPYVEPSRARDGWIVAWSRGSGLQLQSGLGAIADASARCAVVDGRVAQLLINDEVVIDTPADSVATNG